MLNSNKLKDSIGKIIKMYSKDEPDELIILRIISLIKKDIIGEDETITAFWRRYNQVPKDVEGWLDKLICPMARNRLRKEMREKI